MKYTFDEIPEHRDALKYQNECPKEGTQVTGEDGETITAGKSKVFSAFWMTRECLISGNEIDPSVLILQMKEAPTVLIAVCRKK